MSTFKLRKRKLYEKLSKDKARIFFNFPKSIYLDIWRKEFLFQILYKSLALTRRSNCSHTDWFPKYHLKLTFTMRTGNW